MDEFLMREYLRNRSRGMSEQDFIEKMKEHFDMNFARGRGRGRRNADYGDFYEEDEMDMYEDYYMDRERNRERNRNMNRRNDGGGRRRMRHNSEYDFMDMEDMGQEEKRRFTEMLEGNKSEHFNEAYAKYIVSKMYHTEGGRKYVGEKFDMMKAQEICERYKGIIPQSVTPGDVFVAINAQYHDYCELYKAWFGDNIDSKIIESALNFWFKDDDFKEGNKVWKYFNMM